MRAVEKRWIKLEFWWINGGLTVEFWGLSVERFFDFVEKSEVFVDNSLLTGGKFVDFSGDSVEKSPDDGGKAVEFGRILDDLA